MPEDSSIVSVPPWICGLGSSLRARYLMTRLSRTTTPLHQISLAGVHEKSVRHAHISALHIWPACRPLAASRAIVLATLLRDPCAYGDRRRWRERISGRLIQKTLRSGDEEVHRKQSDEGILHCGRESQANLDPFRAESLASFDGRPPRTLDPFAGGHAIPLEAMLLSCETLASYLNHLNPVTWFLLRCTLHNPRWVGQGTSPLAEFALTREGEEFSSVVQAVTRLAEHGPEERSALEILQNHLARGRSATATKCQLWSTPSSKTTLYPRHQERDRRNDEGPRSCPNSKEIDSRSIC